MKFRELLILASEKLYKFYCRIFLRNSCELQQFSMNFRTVYFIHPEYSSERLGTSILRILESTQLCSIATVGDQAESHINAAFFCFSDNLKIYFLSDPKTKHCQNISKRPFVAMAIFDNHQPWGSSLRGLQLFGDCHLAEGSEENYASKLYIRRFPAYGAYLLTLSSDERQSQTFKFYAFHPSSLKILDEDEFGEEVYITARIERYSGIR